MQIILRFHAVRFIPTYVGHTGIGFDRYNALSVHPHLRGAYRRPSTSMACCRGSSPPTWGIPCTLSAFLTAFRFIPTYVGHTLDRRKKNGWFQPLLL